MVDSYLPDKKGGKTPPFTCTKSFWFIFFIYSLNYLLTNLCKWFNLKEAEFIRLYCRFVYNADGKRLLSLREKANYDCILWKDGCTAYGARPVQCSTYPFWPFILQNRQAWDDEALSCPGINKGELHGAEEIEGALNEYRSNSPLEYEEVSRILEGTEL